MKKISISFYFKGALYSSMIRVKEMENRKEYHVTILDWELERLLYGNHIIEEVNNSFNVEISSENPRQTELKLRITSELSRQLKIPCFIEKKTKVTSNNFSESWEQLHPLPRHGRSWLSESTTF